MTWFVIQALHSITQSQLFFVSLGVGLGTENGVTGSVPALLEAIEALLPLSSKWCGLPEHLIVEVFN